MSSDNEPFISKAGDTFTSKETLTNTPAIHWQLYKDGSFTDFCLVTRNQAYEVHRVILVALCTFLYPVLFHNLSVSCLGVDIDDQVMPYLLEYIYLGQVEVPLELATALGDAAKKLGVKQLAEDCQRVMLSQCVPSLANCLSGWVSAINLNDPVIIQKFQSMALGQFKQLVDYASFKLLDFESVKRYLCNPSLSVECPDDRLSAAITWVRADSNNRINQLPTLLSDLDLNKMNKAFVKYLADRDPVVSVHKASRAILLAAAAASVKPASMGSTSATNVSPSLSRGPFASNALSASAAPSSSAAPTSSTAPPSAVLRQLSCTATVWADSHNLSIYPASWTSTPRVVYSPNTNTCQLHERVACCCLGENIYIAGAGQERTSIMKYDVLYKSWQTCGQLRHAREKSCMCVSDSSLLVIAGYKPCSFSTLVRDVEVVDSTTHRVSDAGRLRGMICGSTCCCVCDGGDVAVLGPCDERDTCLLQLYGVKTRAPAACIKLPSFSGAPCGIVHVKGQLVFIDEFGSIYTTPVSAVRQQVGTNVQKITRYTSPNERSVLTQRDSQLILVGGIKAAHHVYTADVTEVLADQGGEWSPVRVGWRKGRWCSPGATCTLSLPVDTL